MYAAGSSVDSSTLTLSGECVSAGEQVVMAFQTHIATAEMCTMFNRRCSHNTSSDVDTTTELKVY